MAGMGEEIIESSGQEDEEGASILFIVPLRKWFTSDCAVIWPKIYGKGHEIRGKSGKGRRNKKGSLFGKNCPNFA